MNKVLWNYNCGENILVNGSIKSQFGEIYDNEIDKMHKG
jgi:hypothetical protein